MIGIQKDSFREKGKQLKLQIDSFKITQKTESSKNYKP